MRGLLPGEMERRKLQNREAQRRYRENIKRKLKMAERQLESKGDSGLIPNKVDTRYGRLFNVQDELGTLDSTSPTLDFCMPGASHVSQQEQFVDSCW